MDPLNSELNLIDKLHTHLFDKTVIAIIRNHTLLKKFDKIIGICNNEIKVCEGYEKFIVESQLFIKVLFKGRFPVYFKFLLDKLIVL